MKHEFQQAGEDCTSCSPRWVKRHKPPVKLVALPSGVAICPFCDGPVLEIAKAAAQKKQDDAAKP